MPTLFRTGPYTFFIVLHDCSERRHIHVKGGDRGEAKYWLEPVVEQAATRGSLAGISQGLSAAYATIARR